MTLDGQRFEAARRRATSALLAARGPAGHWEGELSSSALSTATAVTALAVFEKESKVQSPKSKATGDVGPQSAIRNPQSAIQSGLRWLAQNANPDGGWGDTVLSFSNISTTTLCWAAFGAVPGAEEQFRAVVEGAGRWLRWQAGGTEPERLAPAIIRRYGKDRTFSVPILTLCALAGRLGEGRHAWRWVKPLPFELAACPHQWFAALRLPVVSYALPALIAIGQARHYHRPTRNPITRLLRNATRRRTLHVLTGIQPASGGFLEATPLTSFVTMSLAGSGQAEHPVTRRGVEFLLSSQRADGSWPIDTNLATWVTTLTVDALGGATSSSPESKDSPTEVIAAWLLAQQYRIEHPYTHAAPGGWAWTNLSGGVPDADDTAGALLALRVTADVIGGAISLSSPACGDKNVAAPTEAARAGVAWLLGVQNRDGGIPTFCRGWGALPFDRSSADITAHAIRAWLAWHDDLPSALQPLVNRALARALGFLAQTQRADGAWAPLWFGNQHAPDEKNLTYGTARVLRALVAVQQTSPPSASAAVSETPSLLAKAAHWLMQSQNPDGGWGGAAGTPSSVEETALAVEALSSLLDGPFPDSVPHAPCLDAARRGSQWLVERVESGTWTQPSPIGFYFAKLWYFERLYPLIFTVGALRQAAGLFEVPPASATADAPR